MIPLPTILDQHTLDLLRTFDPVVVRYRAFFALFEWEAAFPAPPSVARVGKPAHPEIASIKAFLV